MDVPAFRMEFQSVDFVDCDLIDRIVGVSPYRPQARTRTVVLTGTVSSGLYPLWFRGPIVPKP